MGQMFDGLYAYEVILMALGVLLFLVLVAILLVHVGRREAYAHLLRFFVVPVIMVGYPSVKSVELGGDVIRIEKDTHDLQKNPADKKRRDLLSTSLEQVAKRPFKEAKAKAIIADAQFALGNKAAAETSLGEALKADPAQPIALEVKERIQLDSDIATWAERAEKNPGDGTVRAKLLALATRADQLKVANPNTLAVVARAQEILGNKARAQEYTDKLKLIDPTLLKKWQLKTEIKPAGADEPKD